MTSWKSKSAQEPEFDGANQDHVKILLEGLNSKYDEIVANLKADLMDAKLQQEEALNIGLMKLPKSIRQMSIKEFNESHQCDLLSLLKSKDGVLRSQSYSISSDTSGKKRDFPMAVAATPAPRSRNRDCPNTEMRTVRKGEGLFSANGSPLEKHEVGAVVATVTKKRRSNDNAANFEINVGDGRVINLNDPLGVQELDSSMKATAASQLKVLQDQMASLMAQLTK